MAPEAPVDRASVDTWLTAAAPDVDARLRATPPARVADVACGEGELSLSLGVAYPLVLVDAWDTDDGSIATARHRTLELGLDDRVRFEVRDGTADWPAFGYDLVIALRGLAWAGDALRWIAAIRSIASRTTHLIVHEALAPSGLLEEAGFEQVASSDGLTLMRFVEGAVNSATSANR